MYSSYDSTFREVCLSTLLEINASLARLIVL